MDKDILCFEFFKENLVMFFYKDKRLEKGIPRGKIGLNHLSKFVCTQ